VDEVKAGRFRDDLYYRINVVQVHVPPLRTRPEDVPPLAQHFLERHARRLGVPVPTLTAELLQVLAAYPWPGNVRELENALERALVVSGGTPGPEHLPPHIRAGRQLFEVRDDEDDLSIKRRLPALERALIERALKRTGGNRTRAAEILELSVRALSYKIQDYGLE
jgi:two-component system, NtrC family, response regulator AtoC